MKKDIERREVLDFGIALIKEKNGDNGYLWDVYVVNLKDTPISHVLVNAFGQGEGDTQSKSTAQIRYYFPEIPALSYQHVEVLLPEVASIRNKYWVSFSHDNYLFDKQYVVEPDEIVEDPDLIIPLIGKLGVWFE